MDISRCKPLPPEEHHGRERSVALWAHEEEIGRWRGSALVFHPGRSDIEEVRHDFQALHATRQAAIDEVRAWAVVHHPA